MSNMNKLIIILGSGGQGQVVQNILRLNGYKRILFLDDHKEGKSITGKLRDFNKFNPKKHLFHVAFGNNLFRKKWYEILCNHKHDFISAIHPAAVLESKIDYSKNVMIGANVYININCSIGNNCIVNTGAIIEHDTCLENHVFMGPRTTTAGGVLIKEQAFIGMGAIINNNLTIEKNCVVAAGAVITRNTKPRMLYAGIPAISKKIA